MRTMRNYKIEYRYYSVSEGHRDIIARLDKLIKEKDKTDEKWTKRAESWRNRSEKGQNASFYRIATVFVLFCRISPSLQGFQMTSLSDRQIEILKCKAVGLTEKETGKALFLSRRSINGHMGEILEKLDVCNDTAAVVVAIREGWINTEELEIKRRCM